MKISAVMIVKNEELMLKKTLPTLSKYMDEIILVDTGSIDGTVKVAEEFKAKIFHFAWINDFSAARNESLKHATGDWVIWIDADEFMREEDLSSLREILASSSADAHSLTLYESAMDKNEKNNGYLRVKVFRNGLGYHFCRPINEQLFDADGKIVSGELLPVSIYHWGKHLAAEKMKAKRARYIDHYSAELKKTPADPYLHFLLANNLSEAGELETALEHYGKSFEHSGGQPIGVEALESKTNILLRLKRLPEAAESAQALLGIDPLNIIARNVLASILMVSGNLDMAIRILTEVLQIKTEGKVENLYQSIGLPNFLLGKSYELKGDS